MRKKEEIGRRSGKKKRRREDTRWLLHNEPAATRGNRNNYAKTERNGASRAKEKKKRRRRRTLWDGAYKRSMPKWDGGGDGMQRRLGIGKRTEPVVRRHLAAPYIFLRLPRFPYPGGERNDELSLSCCSSFPHRGFPFLPESSLLFPRAKISPKRNDSLRFDIFPIVPSCLFWMPIDITMVLSWQWIYDFPTTFFNVRLWDRCLANYPLERK